MTDAYAFDDAPSTDFDPVDFVKAQQRAITSHALGSLDDSPDDAVRATQIAQGSNIPPIVVMGNLENYEKQHKAAITAKLLNNNKFLTDYVASNPMAAKVSNDDWGVLDTVSEKLQQWTNTSVTQKMAEGFRENFDYEGLAKEHKELGDMLRNNPWFGNIFIRQAALAGATTLAGSMRLFSGGIGAVAAGLEEEFRQSGVEKYLPTEMRSSALARDLIIWAQVGLSGQGLELTPKTFLDYNRQLRDEIRGGITVKDASGRVYPPETVEPYLQEGKEPPTGVHPTIDEVKADQAKRDIDNLKDLEGEVHASSTRERSPDDFANFVRQHVGDTNIEIDASAVRQLYGSKLPEVDDGILGWMPGLEEQLRVAEATGGDIKVPLADWLARTEPEIKNELHDFIRIRPDGVNLEEVKFFKEHEAALRPEDGHPLASGDNAVDSIRSAAALDPLFDSERPNKLVIARTDKPTTKAEPLEGVPPHNFSITDVSGKDVGEISLSETNNGKTLFVNWWGAEAGPRSLGPRVIRDLLTQIKQEFPNAENIGGFRISGAREKAGATGDVTISLRSPQALTREELSAFEQQLREIFQPSVRTQFKQGEERTFGEGITGRYKPTELYTQHEQQIIAEVGRYLDRVAPTAKVYPASDIKMHDISGFGGMHIRQPDYSSTILYALENANPLGTAAHETVHHLRKMGLFTEKEWSTLEDLAKKNKWAERWKIAEQWKDVPEADILEETIAEAHRRWRQNAKMIDEAAHPLLKKLQDFLDQIVAIIARITGTQSAADLFKKIETGEIGRRQGDPEGYEVGRLKRQQLSSAMAKPEEPELPGITRMEDRPVFARGDAIGMTQDQLRRYQEWIDKRDQEDAAASFKKIQNRERIRQTQEWKDNREAMRKDVERDIRTRPDIAADEFFRKGMLYGQRIKGKIPKLDANVIAESQRKRIPEEYLSKTRGIFPDDAANLFGFDTGNALIERLATVEEARKVSGLEGKPFLDKVIEDATDQAMERKYGKLDENILSDAKDQVLSKTQLDLLHEDMLALAGKDKEAELSITRDMTEKWLNDQFSNLQVGMANTDAFLRSAGRAGKLAEMNLLKNNPTEALKAKQAQYNALFLAKEAKKFEKLVDKFDATAKRMANRKVAGMNQEYTNWVHDLLVRGDRPIKRSEQDLANEIAAHNKKTFPDFVLDRRNNLVEVDIAPEIMDPKFRKPVEQMTTEEFKAYKDAIDNLVHTGREAEKIYKGGDAFDLAKVKEDLKNQMMTFKVQHYDAKGNYVGEGGIRYKIRTFLANVLQIESLFDRWDRGNPNGPWKQFISRDLANAANEEAKLEKKYSQRLRGVEDKADLSERVENNIFMNPQSRDAGVPYPIAFTRENLRAVLLNAGNENNLSKLGKGYFVHPDTIMNWLHTHATKEDWDWAQKIGNIFKDLKAESDEMYRRIAGIAPENVEINPIQTPHGKYDGWYYPLIAHPVWKAKGSEATLGPKALEETNYIRATPPRGYTKKRTGAVYPLALDLDMMAVRMKGEIHDIAFREAVLDAGKIFYDPEIHNTITNHYGKEYANLLVPYLRDVANAANFQSEAASVAKQTLETIRQNVIATLIGFNPGTVMKHGPTAAMNSLTEVGIPSFVRELTGLMKRNDETGTSNWRYAMDKSTELQRRVRHYNETLGGAQDKILGTDTWRDALIKAGATPVALSDLLSAVPTWLAKYKDMIREGATEGDAVAGANYAVRRAHGSTAITNRAGIARGGALASWFTSLYGFFSHILNRQYELGWRSSETLGKFSEGKYKEGFSDIPRLTTMLVSYIIVPAVIEEYVSGHGDPKEGWLHYAARALSHGLASSWPGLRDVAHGLAYGQDPSAGLISTAGRQVAQSLHDVGRMQGAFSKDRAGTTLQHSITMFGMLTGWTNAQEGKAAKFIYNYSTGQEKPKYLADWWHGLRFGTMKERK